METNGDDYTKASERNKKWHALNLPCPMTSHLDIIASAHWLEEEPDAPVDSWHYLSARQQNRLPSETSGTGLTSRRFFCCKFRSSIGKTLTWKPNKAPSQSSKSMSGFHINSGGILNSPTALNAAIAARTCQKKDKSRKTLMLALWTCAKLLQLTLATINSITPASQTHARRLQRLNVPRESSWRHSRSSQDPPMGGCYTQDSPFPQVCRSSRPFPPRSSKPPSNCLPVCLLKQVEPTPHFFFFCSSGSCDAYSPFLRSRCCRCCFINSIFFFFNSSASSYPLFSFFRFRSSSIFRLFFFNSSALLILILALLLPMLLLLLLLHQNPSINNLKKQICGKKIPETAPFSASSCSCSLFSFNFSASSDTYYSLSAASHRRRCYCFINSHQTATSKNGFAAPPQKRKQKTKTFPKTALFSASSYSLLTLLLQPNLLFSFTCSRCSPLLQLHQSSNFTNGFCYKRILQESCEELPLVRKIPTREAMAV